MPKVSLSSQGSHVVTFVEELDIMVVELTALAKDALFHHILKADLMLLRLGLSPHYWRRISSSHLSLPLCWLWSLTPSWLH